MKKDDGVYIGHILDLGEKIRFRLSGIQRSEFDANEDLRIVIAHFIQNIGESARRVCESLRNSHPEIPWRDIIGMRHRLVHDYLDIDYDIVWEVATIELPLLMERLRDLMNQQAQGE